MSQGRRGPTGLAVTFCTVALTFAAINSSIVTLDGNVCRSLISGARNLDRGVDELAEADEDGADDKAAAAPPHPECPTTTTTPSADVSCICRALNARNIGIGSEIESH